MEEIKLIRVNTSVVDYTSGEERKFVFIEKQDRNNNPFPLMTGKVYANIEESNVLVPVRYFINIDWKSFEYIRNIYMVDKKLNILLKDDWWNDIRYWMIILLFADEQEMFQTYLEKIKTFYKTKAEGMLKDYLLRTRTISKEN